MKLLPSFRVLLFVACAPLGAITIQNTSTPGYATGNSVYTGVASIIGNYTAGGSFSCTGALISSTVILTAGHCVAPANSWNVTFQTGSGTTTIAVASSQVHDGYQSRPSPNSGISQYDIAILRLATSAPVGTAIYGITDGSTAPTFGDITGSLVDMVGYGIGGNPSGGLASGTRRYAQNRLDGFLPGQVDNPLLTSQDFSSALEPGGYGIVGAGDSGGPMFLNNIIIGVASASTIPSTGGSGTYTNGTYYGLHTSLFDTVTRDWTNAAFGVMATPEPSTYLLFGSGLAALAFFRRRR